MANRFHAVSNQMAEAPLKWKIETLKQAIAAPLHARFAPTPNTEEMAWFIDMQKDGYIDGTWCREVNKEEITAMIQNRFPIPTGGREVFSDLHVSEKGKKFVRDYDANQKVAEDFKTIDVQKLLKWDDKKLAEWQSQYKPDEAQWILADQEWKRRAGVSTRRIAIAAIVVSILSLLVAALGYFHSLTNAIPVKPLGEPVQQPQLPVQQPQ